MSWPKIKIIVLKWHLLLFCASNDNFLVELRCAMKSGFYMTTSDDQVSGWTEKPKHFSKSNLYQKRSKSGFGGLLSLDPLQLSESWWNHYIWKVCSANWWYAPKTATPKASINRKGPILLHNNAQVHVTQPMLQKFNELDYEVLLHLPYSPDLSSTNFYFFKHLDNFL